jgi:hypothetical protein
MKILLQIISCRLIIKDTRMYLFKKIISKLIRVSCMWHLIAHSHKSIGYIFLFLFYCHFLDFIVMQHIFTWLPLMPSMPWHFHWMNKTWVIVIVKNLPWNALELTKINHRSYFQHLATSGTPRQLVQMYFELFENMFRSHWPSLFPQFMIQKMILLM